LTTRFAHPASGLRRRDVRETPTFQPEGFSYVSAFVEVGLPGPQTPALTYVERIQDGEPFGYQL